MTGKVQIIERQVQWPTVLIILYEEDSGEGLTFDELCEDDAWLIDPRGGGLSAAVVDASRLWLIRERGGRWRLTAKGIEVAGFLVEARAQDGSEAQP